MTRGGSVRQRRPARTRPPTAHRTPARSRSRSTPSGRATTPRPRSRTVPMPRGARASRARAPGAARAAGPMPGPAATETFIGRVPIGGLFLRRRVGERRSRRGNRRPAAAAHVRGSRTPTGPPQARAAPSPAQRPSGTTKYLLNDGSSEASTVASSRLASDRNSARSERRIIHLRGPAFEARSSPFAIQRRTVTTVTCSSSATCATVDKR